MLRLLDLGLLALIGAYLVVLSVILLIRIIRGEQTGYGQLSLLPESWRRWMLDEKANNK